MQKESNFEHPSHRSIASLMERAKSYKSPTYINSSREIWKSKEIGDGLDFSNDEYDPKDPSNQIFEGRVWVPKSNPEVVLPDPSDFENLRFISPEKAKEALQQMERQVLELGSGQGISLVIGTGGTIAMKNVHGELIPQLDVDEVLEYAGHSLRHSYELFGLEFPRAIDSSQMYPDYIMDIIIAMTAIYNRASEKLKEKFTGFMVTHGTDTMAWSAADAAMALGPKPPFSVVFAGAQRTTQAQFPDAGINVVNGLNTLRKLSEARKETVVIVMGGTSGGAYLGVGGEKKTDTGVMAFESAGHAKVIDFSDSTKTDDIENPFLVQLPPHGIPRTFKPTIYNGTRPSFRISPDMGSDYDGVYNRVKASPEPVVILESFGTGTAHRHVVDATVTAARETEKAVILVSPFAAGGLKHEYKEALYAVKAGAIPVEMMPAALTAKIHLAHTMFGNDPRRIERFIADTNYVGEQFSSWEPRKMPEGKKPRDYFGSPSGFTESEWEGKM